MATTYTTNYNLGKQENHADKFDMDVITDNADKIDAALTGLQSSIDGKQATLTTAQLAAVNSGITSTDVEQIETNKNNIYSLQALTGSYRVLLSSTPVNGIYFGVYNFPRPQSTPPAVTLTVGTGTQGGGVVDPEKFSTNVYDWGFRVYTTETSYAGLIIQVTIS